MIRSDCNRSARARPKAMDQGSFNSRLVPRGTHICKPSALSCDGLYSAGWQLDDTERHQFAALRIDLSGLKSAGCEGIAIWGCVSRDVLAASAVEPGGSRR